MMISRSKWAAERTAGMTCRIQPEPIGEDADPYPAHILCAQELDWIDHWPTRFEERRKLMTALRDDIANFAKQFPHSRRLQELKKRIDERYLELASPKIKEEAE